MTMDRRQYLAGEVVVITGVVAGCIGSFTGGTDFAPAEDPWSQQKEFELPNGNGLSGVVTLPAGTYAQFGTNQPLGITLEVTAKANQPFDMFVLDRNEFSRYRDQEQFQYYEAFAALRQKQIRLSGTWTNEYYHIVFDNTIFTDTARRGDRG
jgi:hypothetical protein